MAQALDDVGVDHRRLPMGVPQQFLHLADVDVLEQKMRRERMPEGVHGSVLGHAARAARALVAACDELASACEHSRYDAACDAAYALQEAVDALNAVARGAYDNAVLRAASAAQAVGVASIAIGISWAAASAITP